LLEIASLGIFGCKGRDENARSPRDRVVSLSPSTTEAVFALGAASKLVGRSRFCDHPPEALALPAVGGYADPSVEAIVALSPALVVGARGPAGPVLEQTLRAHSIETFFPETESIAQIEGMLTELGRRLGSESAAARLVARLEAQLAAVSAAVAGRPAVRAIFLFDVAPIVAAGPGSFPDELLRRAGGENLIRRGGAYPTIGLEHLLALDPDVILDGARVSHDAASILEPLRTAPGWRDLRAMKEGRIRSFQSASVLRPGPRIGEGLFAVARALYGDDLVIVHETQAPSGGPPP
jgi:iron complex transport system substrate-binding protein